MDSLKPLGSERYGLTLDSARADGPTHSEADVGIAELQALQEVEVVLPEHMDLDRFEATRRLFERQTAADDLRLPPPPARSADGELVFRMLTKAVGTYAERRSVPVSASEQAITAEAKMMGVMAGIQRLQSQIHAQRDRQRSV